MFNSKLLILIFSAVYISVSPIPPKVTKAIPPPNPTVTHSKNAKKLNTAIAKHAQLRSQLHNVHNNIQKHKNNKNMLKKLTLQYKNLIVQYNRNRNIHCPKIDPIFIDYIKPDKYQYCNKYYNMGVHLAYNVSYLKIRLGLVQLNQLKNSQSCNFTFKNNNLSKTLLYYRNHCYLRGYHNQVNHIIRLYPRYKKKFRGMRLKPRVEAKNLKRAIHTLKKAAQK